MFCLQDQSVAINLNEWEKLKDHKRLAHLHLGGSFQKVELIPHQWSQMENLYHLNISENNFTGILPESFSEFKSIHHLEMSNNKF